jgi:hypothetical protein
MIRRQNHNQEVSRFSLASSGAVAAVSTPHAGINVGGLA